MSRQWLRGANTLVSFVLMCWLADFASNRFAFSDGWTIVWPLNGITAALLLKRPRSAGLMMLVGVALGAGVGECMDNNSVGLEIGQRLCSVTEVLVCASVLPRYTDLQEWLRTPHIHARFVAALAFNSPQMRQAFAGRAPWKTAGLLVFAFAGAALIFFREPLSTHFLVVPVAIWLAKTIACSPSCASRTS